MRNVLLWTLVISLVATAGCAQAPKPEPNPPVSRTDIDIQNAINDCKATGSVRKDKHKPVVCVTVHPGGASVNPLVVPAAFRLSSGKNKIKFVSRGVDKFDIEFENADCVDLKDLACDEQCDASVRETALPGKECKYSVVVTRDEGGRLVKIKLDPIVIIDTE